MSEMTLQPGLSDGLERMWLAVESLCNRLERARLESTAEWQIRAIARLTEEIEEMIRWQVAMADWSLSAMKSFWKIMWRSAGRVPETTWASGGRELQDFFDGLIAQIEITRNHVEKYEKHLGRPLGLERVNEILLQARQMRKDLETNWLWITKEAEDEAKASMARGEGMDVEEAFAQMTGLTVEELRAKVEAHRRKYHPAGNSVR